MTAEFDQLKELWRSRSAAERLDFIEWARSQSPRHTLEEKWGVKAEIILNAIERSADLTKRGIRGVIAEAIFEAVLAPGADGWRSTAIFDRPYDFLLERDQHAVRVQIKLQRMERHEPKFASKPYPAGMFVVEVQRTRGGRDRKTGRPTRPYAFGEFDILGVNLHPSTGDWERFLFTPAAWLVPRKEDRDLMAIFQPVPKEPNEHWTADLNECLSWVQSGRRGQIFELAER